MIEPGTSTYQMLHASVLLLLLAGLADVLDGAIARAMRAESEFGFRATTSLVEGLQKTIACYHHSVHQG